jgi:predicted aconitase with swiveling domain
MTGVVVGRSLAHGAASGPTLTLSSPLSLWGGVDPTTGLIVDPRHPDTGASLAGRIVVIPAVRGSSSSSSVLAELVRAGVGPLGIVLGQPDEILAIGAVVAAELYGVACPIVLVEPSDYAHVAAASVLTIDIDGRITLPGSTVDRRGRDGPGV